MGTALLQAVVNGLLIGSLYAVMAMGLAIIFGVMRVINLAHGEFIMLGMYLSFWVVTLLQGGRGVAMLIGLPIFLLFGAFLYRAFVNRVQQRSGEMGTLLITFGLAYIIANTAQIGWSADYRVLSAGSVAPLRVAGLSISVSLLWAFAIAILLTAATYVFLIYTDPGKAIRATSQDAQAAALMGVNVTRVNTVAFGLGATLAGIAGVLVSPVFYIYPYVGSVFLVTSFVVVVLGGMGSIIGATVGGLLFGVLESVAGLFISSGYRPAVGLVVFLIVLVLKPSGLFTQARI